MSRRTFVAAAALGVAGCASIRHDDDAPLLHVGTFTDGTKSEGVYRFRMDASTGLLRPLGPVDAGPNPAFLARHPTRDALFVANEVTTFEGRPSGSISAFAVDDDTGALTLRNRRSSGGTGPAYVSVDRSGRYALAANYAGGSVAVLPIGADDTLGEPSAVMKHSGTGPNKDRQEAPHAHCIIADPSSRYVLATDLGIDRIMVYALDAASGALTPAPTPFVAAAPGAGPRHLAFHPNGALLFATNELDITLSSYRWDASAGTLTHVQTVPIVTGAHPGPDTAADVHVAPSGRFVYATVRGANMVGVHAVDASTGRLTPVQQLPCEGNWPRNFGLDPSGRFVYVANQRSDDITLFRVDTSTGRLTFTGQRVSVPSPVCIRFA
jgi:6-phosphogluconolactonase